MKVALVLLISFNVVYAATYTRVISKVTDTYQVRSGHAKLVESEYEVGTFNDVDGTATDIQTITQKQTQAVNSTDSKLEQVLKISGNEKSTVASKKISQEICNTSGNKKYCSTSIELTF